jgi:hypothetical protein
MERGYLGVKLINDAKRRSPVPGMQTEVPMTFVHQGCRFILVAVATTQKPQDAFLKTKG